MATVKVPQGCTQITLSSSGSLIPDSNRYIVCTASEATQLTSPYNFGVNSMGVKSTDASGNTSIQLPSVVTQITVNGNVYTPLNGVISGVINTDAAVWTSSLENNSGTFMLVSG